MNKSTSQLSLSTYCHNISEENYFLSPKMPVKDHALAFRSTMMTPKQAPSQVVLPSCRNREEFSKRSTPTISKNHRLFQRASTPCRLWTCWNRRICTWFPTVEKIRLSTATFTPDKPTPATQEMPSADSTQNDLTKTLSLPIFNIIITFFCII